MEGQEEAELWCVLLATPVQHLNAQFFPALQAEADGRQQMRGAWGEVVGEPGVVVEHVVGLHEDFGEEEEWDLHCGTCHQYCCL